MIPIHVNCKQNVSDFDLMRIKLVKVNLYKSTSKVTFSV